MKWITLSVVKDLKLTLSFLFSPDFFVCSNQIFIMTHWLFLCLLQYPRFRQYRYGVFLYEIYLNEAKKQGYCEALPSSPPVSCRIQINLI